MQLAYPIRMTSTFNFKEKVIGAGIFAGTIGRYVYSRLSNPTIIQLEEKLALTESAEDTIVTSSDMATSASTVMSLVPA